MSDSDCGCGKDKEIDYLIAERDRLKAELEQANLLWDNATTEWGSWKQKAEGLVEALRKIAQPGTPDNMGVLDCYFLAKAALEEFGEGDGPKKTNNLTYEDTV